MKLNVVQAPSVRLIVLEEVSLTNENTNNSKHVDDNKSSSEDESPIRKQTLITLKITLMNRIYSLEVRWLTWYIVVGTVHDVAEDM